MKEPQFIPTEQELASEIDQLKKRVRKLEGQLTDRAAQADAQAQKMSAIVSKLGNAAVTGDLDQIVSVLARGVLAASGERTLSQNDRTKLENWTRD